MKAKFLSFKSGVGDCLFLELNQDGEKYSIMVDCHEFAPDIENYVFTELGKHINLLIVTHIDKDHVCGITQMLTKHPDLIVDKIIFNCFQVVGDTNTELPDEDKKILEELNKIPTRSNVVSSQISVPQAASLAKTILKNKAWGCVWEKQPTTSSSADLELGENSKWGSIKWLSPTQKVLDKLYNTEFKKTYNRYFHKLPPEGGFKQQEEVFEVLIKLDDIVNKSRQQRNTKIASVKLCASLFERLKDERVDERTVSISNYSSLAFEWKCGEKSVLFLGDALSSQVESALKVAYDNIQKYDVIKVSHHGSAYSTTSSLYAFIDAPCYFVSGGNNNDKPSAEALSKILCRKTSGGNRRLYFSNPSNKVVKWLLSDEARVLRDKYNFSLEESNEIEF